MHYCIPPRCYSSDSIPREDQKEVQNTTSSYEKEKTKRPRLKTFEWSAKRTVLSAEQSLAVVGR